MSMILDILSIMVSVLGVVLTVAFYIKDHRNYNIISSRYEYRHTREEAIIETFRKKYFGRMFIASWVAACIGIIDKYDLINSLSGDLWIPRICTTVFVWFMFVMVLVIGEIISLIDNERLNELIEGNDVFFDSVTKGRVKLNVGLLVIVAIGTFIFRQDNKELLLYSCVAFVFCLCVDAICCFYLYEYLDVRLSFFVKKTIIKVKDKDVPYQNVKGYKMRKKVIKILYIENGELNVLYCHKDNVEYIERTVSDSKSYLNERVKK